MHSHRLALTAAALFVAASAAHPQAPGYHIVHSYALGGTGSWDYLAFDPVGHRLFISRQDRIMVVDPATGALIGVIPGIKGAHGVALANASGHGFATSGNDSLVVMFDNKTLKPLGRSHAAEDADGILFDPASKRVFTMNGDANSSSVIDPATGRNIGTVPLGGKPEFGVSAGDGKVYANLTDKGEVVEIDASAMKVIRRWPVAPCASSTGLSIDVAHHRLFTVCRNKYLAISDYAAGKLVTTVPIGAGVDASAFDPTTQLIFASNGDGTLTVVHEDTPDKYTVVETVPTGAGAKTMALDPSTHRLYLGTASFGPVDPNTAAGRRGRPPMIPGTFKLLVLDRK
ncbi:MAG: YncE family protein [Gemmatimonadales bacterium]